MKVQPVTDKVFLRDLTEEESMKPGDLGIYIPDSAKKENKVALIMAIGPDVKNPLLKEGTEVMLSSMVFKDAVPGGFIVKETDIIGIVT